MSSARVSPRKGGIGLNTMMNQLLDVDKEARQILDDAQQYYDRTLLDIQEEKKRLREHYNEKAAQHLGILTSTQTAEVDEAVNKLRDRTTVLLEAMNARYDQYRQQWVDELTEKCIGR